MEALLRQNASFQHVIAAATASGVSMSELCELASALLGEVSAGYLQRLGKEIASACGEGEVPEAAYELISNAMCAPIDKQDEGFCWVSYDDTRIRILDPHCAMVADLDGDFLGLRLWEAEICALEWMVANPHRVARGDVLEIGCGVSLAGFAALEAMGASSLTLCDYNPRVMDNLQVMLARKPAAVAQRTRLVQLDWNLPKRELAVRPSLIIAADCVYDPNDIPNFVRTLVELMEPAATCLLVCSVRNPKTYAALTLELTKHRLRVEREEPGPPRYSASSTHMMTRNWKRQDVELFSLSVVASN